MPRAKPPIEKRVAAIEKELKDRTSVMFGFHHRLEGALGIQLMMCVALDEAVEELGDIIVGHLDALATLQEEADAPDLVVDDVEMLVEAVRMARAARKVADKPDPPPRGRRPKPANDK